MLIKLLFRIELFLLILGQLISLSKSGGFNVYLFDLFLLIFVSYGFVYFLFLRKTFKLPIFLAYFIGFCLIALFSLVRVFPQFSNTENLVAFSYLVRLFLYVSAGLVVHNMYIQNIIKRDELFNLIIYSGLLLAVFGFVQLVILPDFEVLDPVYGWDPHKNRLASTFFDPNFTGAYLVICMAVLFEKLYSLKKIDWFGYLQFIILLLGIFLTFSRSAWLMFAVLIFVYGLSKSKKLLAAAVIVAFCAYFAVPRVQTRIVGVTDPADSAHFRLISWSNTTQIINDHWVFGVGYNTFRFVQKDYTFLNPDDYLDNAGAGSDSSLLFVFATTGIFGIALYLTSYLYALRYSVSRNSENKTLVIAVLMGLLVESQFINSLFYPQILFLILILIPNCLERTSQKAFPR